MAKRKIKHKPKQPAGRIPTAPPTRWHDDKSKYNRRKEKNTYDE